MVNGTNSIPSTSTVALALISDVFFGPGAEQRLRARLREAKQRGASLAILPELPFDRWIPATRDVNDEDAERSDGPRQQTLARAAKDVGVATIGGAIVRDLQGRRRNTVIAVDARGVVIGRYAKLHIPDEQGFWERDHYEPGAEPPREFDVMGIRCGVLVCSDINRPGAAALAKAGVDVIVNPRATERATFERWKLVFRATALTCSTYVVSVNRPVSEQGVALGGPSIVVDPNGEVVLETVDTIAIAQVSHESVEQARRSYPGYLSMHAGIYAAAWQRLGS